MHEWRPRGGYPRRPNFKTRRPAAAWNHISSWGQPNTEEQNSHEDFWCETCDRGFRTLKFLENHTRQHEKCNIDGCQFVAHPKVITRHIQLQHSTGLYEKIKNLNNPEEIKKWRDERKRNYPTLANIQRKAAEVKEKIERGEKIGLKSNDKYNLKQETNRKRKNSNDENHSKKYMRKQTNSNNVAKNKRLVKKIAKTENVSEDITRILKPFTGIQLLVMENDLKYADENMHSNMMIDDDDDIILKSTNTNQDPVVVKPAVCGALTSLICNYGFSDDESESDDPRKNENILDKAEVIKVNKTDNEKKTVNNHDSDDDSGPEETKLAKYDDKVDAVQEVTSCKDKKQIMKNNPKNVLSKRNKIHKLKLPSTLLEKLLQKEIQQERNIILQCIRHIVKNNYFE